MNNDAPLPSWVTYNMFIYQLSVNALPSILSNCTGAYTSLPLHKPSGASTTYEQCVHEVRITASDKIFNVSTVIQFIIFNEGPYYNQPVYMKGGVEAPFELCVTQHIDFTIADTAFMDDDDPKNAIHYSIRS